jgi:hypothetical protein
MSDMNVRPSESAGIKDQRYIGECAKEGGHSVEIEGDREWSEEACGKPIFGCNVGLTYWERMLILVSSLQATLLDREAEQTLFDNLIDVPESVRPRSSLRA